MQKKNRYIDQNSNKIMKTKKEKEGIDKNEKERKTESRELFKK